MGANVRVLLIFSIYNCFLFTQPLTGKFFECYLKKFSLHGFTVKHIKGQNRSQYIISLHDGSRADKQRPRAN